MSTEKEFLLDLANLLERHSVAICSRNTGQFSEVFFQQRKKGMPISVNIEAHSRCHVTAYDVRGVAGMSCQEANDMYQTRKRILEES